MYFTHTQLYRYPTLSSEGKWWEYHKVFVTFLQKPAAQRVHFEIESVLNGQVLDISGGQMKPGQKVGQLRQLGTCTTGIMIYYRVLASDKRSFLILWSFCGWVDRMTKYVLIISTMERPRNDLATYQCKYYGEVDKKNWGSYHTAIEGLVNHNKTICPNSFHGHSVVIPLEWKSWGRLGGKVCTASEGLA